MNTCNRLLLLDVLRGLAMVWMTIYHFCFDLNHFGWIHQDLGNSPFWVLQRSLIVALFLFCVGWSQSVRKTPANANYLNSLINKNFWCRWFQIALCALLVSFGSYLVYPGTWIYFGVLHSIAVMLLVIFAIKPWVDGSERGDFLILLLGCLSVITPAAVTKTWNNAPWGIIGLAPAPSKTEDFVPLLPWFSLVCAGYAFGMNRHINSTQQEGFPEGISWPTSKLAVLGRYSLIYYMLHQPIMIALVASISRF